MAAWYSVPEGEVATIGDTKKKDSPLNAMSRDITDVGFVHKGKFHMENDLAEIYMDASHELPKKTGMPAWAEITPIDGDGVVFCMATYNPKHSVTDIHRWRDLPKGQTVNIEMIGFLCVVEGNVTINDVVVLEGELVKLSGKSITVVATEDDVTLAALEIEKHDPDAV
jgi:hypothetical protein